MIREEGFYIVQQKQAVEITEHFLWIYSRKGKKYFLVDDGYPTSFTEDYSFILEKFTIVKKLHIGRKDLDFSKTKITLTTNHGNSQFRFEHRNLLQFYRLIALLLPGIGKSLMFSGFLQKIINDLKQGRIDRKSL